MFGKSVTHTKRPKPKERSGIKILRELAESRGECVSDVCPHPTYVTLDAVMIFSCQVHAYVSSFSLIIAKHLLNDEIGVDVVKSYLTTAGN